MYECLVCWKLGMLPWWVSGPVLLLWHDAVARILANGNAAFLWKLRCHWLKGLRQRPIAVAWQGLGPFQSYSTGILSFSQATVFHCKISGTFIMQLKLGINTLLGCAFLIILLLPPPWWRLCFHRCPLLCLFVCLSVSNITGKWLNGFSLIFQGRWDLIQGTIGNIFRMFHLTPWTQEFFPTFSEESMTLSSITEKRLNGFSWNFQKRTDLTQGAIWNTFGMLRLTPWILGRFIYFLDPCLFVILWENGWMDFHEIFIKRHAQQKK